MDQREYYLFMGYPTGPLRERYVPYAERFKAGDTVVDIGCGRGEFLELLRDGGMDGIGVDPDAGMVEDVRAKGLEAVQSDGLSYLKQHPLSCDGIFMAHVAEHLPPEHLVVLIHAAAQALRPGGRLMLVTPNPQNLQMQLHDFWIDLQHVRFYNPHGINLLFYSSGFVEREVGGNPLYRLGPDWAVDGLPRLSVPPAAASSSSRLRRRIGRRAKWDRIAELEARVNLLSEWVSTLYPSGEFFVTGVRPPAGSGQ